MAYFFGDSFDLYATTTDTLNGYWDSGVNAGTLTLVAGRFAGGLAIQAAGTNSIFLVKSSGQNDAVHHLSVAVRYAFALSGTNLLMSLQLFDGATVQCSIVFRSDGAILLTSGAPAGTVLATYTGALTATNTWYQFECEVVVNNTTGSFTVRKNGNPVNDFTLGSLNTRGGTANNYANRLQVGNTASGLQQIDDLLWRSDASAVPWAGDVRCYTRMPGSDVAVQWSRTPTGALSQTVGTSGSSLAISNTQARFMSFVASYSGTVTSTSVAATTGNSGNTKAAIYDATGASGGPGAVLGTSAPISPLIAGSNVFTFSGVPVVKGATYWVAVISDTSVGNFSGNSGTTTGQSAVVSYAAFPQPNPVTASAQAAVQMSWTFTATPANWQTISEAQQDATSSYVYSANAGDADLYGLQAITGTPATILATTLRGYAQKSDAGARAIALNIKSGSTLSTGSNLVLSASGFGWGYRTDLVDPNTGAAWTATAVNNLQVGATVTV
jgi:hypothetical protein